MIKPASIIIFQIQILWGVLLINSGIISWYTKFDYYLILWYNEFEK